MKKTIFASIFAGTVLLSASSLSAAPNAGMRIISSTLSATRSLDMPIPEPGNPNVPMAFDIPIPEPGNPNVPMLAFDMPIPEPGRKTVPMDMPIPEPGRKTVPMARQS
ncbi:MAG TPA: hypothetical protein VH477_15505 [Bryobacteraceae bacterium]